ncbi:MAG TPA: hypothetical protein VH593_24855 [Ktedonobacteraceae bacterium]|jgi:hypothetical protein
MIRRVTTRKRSTQARAAAPKQAIKRGILAAFYPATYTADILIMEATSCYLQGVPIACHMDGTSAQVNAMCAVLFFDAQNPADAVILAVYPNGSQGIPVPAPGRLVLTTGYQQFVNQAITSSTVYTATLVGHGGIPFGAIAVLVAAYFTSPSANAYVQFAPHSGSIGDYFTLGNLAVANGYINGNAILPLDSQGRIDVRANNGNCTVTLATQGYVQ